MSKALDATCNAQGKVTAEGVQIPAQVLSAGKKASSGVVVIDGEKVWYFTSNASDITDLITKLVTIINQVGLIATNLDAVTVSPGSATALITQLQVMKTELDSGKELLK